MKPRRALVAMIAASMVYFTSYGVFRARNVERWSRDGHEYVIVPLNASWLFYALRPAMYVDGAVTGMRFHIGPHR